MEIVRASKDNLASVIMGKNIQFPWRSQRGVIISVPFDEWKVFIRQYKDLLKYRKPLDYNRMFEIGSEEIQFRYFMYEISWALYSEIACSSNVGKDCTLILPHFNDGIRLSCLEVLKHVNNAGADDIKRWDNSLVAATRNYYNLVQESDCSFGIVDVSSLSQWNMLAYKLCMYLQSKSSNKLQIEKVNIDLEV